MKRSFAIAVAVAAAFTACQQKAADKPAAAPAAPMVTSADLTTMANAVPNTGPREGNNYKVFFLVLRQNTSPAANFKVDFWVKGKSEPKTYRTNESGFLKVEDLPYPDVKHHLNAVLHYYKGKNDQPREIDYPFLDTDAYRLKDSQYIPNTVTPDPQ